MTFKRRSIGRSNPSISVVIPVLNEAENISSVIEIASSSPRVCEVIVVDDGSIDGTPDLARTAGATVVTSTLLGKGASMEDGLRQARSELIVYLDGDLAQLRSDAVELLVDPIDANRADFVKAGFSRAGGRVTALTAKPLIQTYFPELSCLSQPLGGIIAARRSVLEKLRFENDYGVDAGLLIDAFLAQARIAEVDVGNIEHRSKPLEKLGEMANQVARAILERAARAGRLRLSYIRDSRENERLRRLSLAHSIGQIPPSEKFALFDMDGVLLNGRFVVSLARAVGRQSALAALLDNYSISAEERMRQIGEVFSGVRRETFERVARSIPLSDGAVETVVNLRKRGFRVGIVTDSYQAAAEIVRRRVFADFTFSHSMRFKNDRATGTVQLCPAMIHANGCRLHDHCKVNVMQHLMERFELPGSEFLAVGDGENDVCLLKAAAVSVAYRPKTAAVQAAARFVSTDLADVVRFVAPQRNMDGDLATDL